jgi:hypothetical protein
MHGGGTFTDADGEDGRDAGGLSAGEDLVAVCGAVGVEIEMCV